MTYFDVIESEIWPAYYPSDETKERKNFNQIYLSEKDLENYNRVNSEFFEWNNRLEKLKQELI